MIPRPLSTYLTWPDVAKEFGLCEGAAPLPTTIRCPECRGRLRVYPTVTCGAWHRCLNCHKVSGDLIELAARKWGISIPDVFQRLVEDGFPLPLEQVKGYPDPHYERRERINKTWLAARHYLTSYTPTLNRLMARLGVHGYVPSYLEGCQAGRLFGALPLNEVHRLLVPYAITTTSMGRASRHDRLRIGRGSGWDDVVVLPFENAPGRICGFEFIGRAGTPEDRCDWTCETEGDAGLFGLGMLDDAIEAHGSRVVITPDALDLLHIQLDYLRLSRRPLPLVSFWNGEKGASSHVWQFLSDARERIFWAKRIDARVIAEAIRRDGKLVIQNVTKGEGGRDLYGKLVRQAKPWRTALALILDSIPDPPAEVLLADLEQHGVLLADLIAACPKHATRIESLRRPPPCQVAEGDGYRIAEKNGVWYDVSSPGCSIQILNGIIRIDRIETRDKSRFFVGRLLKDERQIPFDIKVPSNCRLTTPLNQVCKQEGIGPLRARSPWRTRLTQIACLFHTPQRIEVAPGRNDCGGPPRSG